MTVVERPFFLRQAEAGLLTDDEREQLIAFVGANPEVGDVIPEWGGIGNFAGQPRAREKAAA